MTDFHGFDLQKRIAVRKGLRTNGSTSSLPCRGDDRQAGRPSQRFRLHRAGFPERGKADGAVAVHHREERHFPTAVDIILCAFRQTEPIRQGEKNVGSNGAFSSGETMRRTENAVIGCTSLLFM